MKKLAVEIATENAIEAIKTRRILAEVWGNKDNRKINISFNYPRNDKKINEIEISLSDVRASDGIKINYDFDRDGYVIMQPYYVDGEEHWKEVGFFMSWALEDENTEIN